MVSNFEIGKQKLIQVFPDLRNDINFKILSPYNAFYNCIAWAMGYTDRWVDHNIYVAGHWWPAGVELEGTTAALIHAFEAEGFVMADNNLPEDGYEKVALYKKRDSDEWTHASKILSENIEHSKFGQGWDGQHSHNVLCNTGIGYENNSYGEVFAYMKRFLPKVPTETQRGKVIVDKKLLEKLKSILKR